MRLLAPAVLLILGGLVSPESSLPEGAPQGAGQTAAAVSVAPTITIPPGTKVTLALTSPIWAKTVKAGDAVYAVTAFPVVTNGTMLIPPGTYVLGQIDSITKPGWLSPRAQFQIHFLKIIFANGYTVELADAPAQAATATVHVGVTARNDVLLDNGGQFDMTVQTPLPLDANRIADAVRRSRPFSIRPVSSASLCRPIPATPGTPDTVIPGTPGTPGTPDITIPGPNGTSTTIPGTPPTPGTQDTVIRGFPGTPAIPCPAPPAVVPGLSGPQVHRQSFQVANEVQVSGKMLAPGSYEVTWLGTASEVQLELLKGGKMIAQARGRIGLLAEKSPANKVVTRTNPDGSNSIASLEFAGESFVLILD